MGPVRLLEIMSVQLGVEVPCVYKLYGRQAYIKRLEELLSEL